jgi:BlaI family penicillinase repressor
MTRRLPRPTDAELEILAVLWETGPATVREVFDRLAQKRTAQYSTVLKFLQIMTEKGLVRRDETERAHIYQTAQSRESTQQQLVGDLVDRAFAGSAKALVLGALSARKASKRELTEIHALLKRFEKENG